MQSYFSSLPYFLFSLCYRCIIFFTPFLKRLGFVVPSLFALFTLFISAAHELHEWFMSHDLMVWPFIFYLPLAACSIVVESMWVIVSWWASFFSRVPACSFPCCSIICASGIHLAHESCLPIRNGNIISPRAACPSASFLCLCESSPHMISSFGRVPRVPSLFPLSRTLPFHWVLDARYFLPCAKKHENRMRNTLYLGHFTSLFRAVFLLVSWGLLVYFLPSPRKHENRIYTSVVASYQVLSAVVGLMSHDRMAPFFLSPRGACPQ